MTATPSELLQLQIIDVGTEDDTWGTIDNNTLKRLEQAAHGEAAITIAGSNVTLSDTQYIGTQSHKKVLKLTGSQTANVDVIVPARTHVYYVLNDTSDGGGGPYAITVKVSGQTGVSLAHGEHAILYANGTDVEEVFSTTTYQPLSALLTAIAAVTPTDGNFLVGNGTTFVAEDADTARDSLEIDGASKVLEAGDYGDGTVGTDALVDASVTRAKLATVPLTRTDPPPEFSYSGTTDLVFESRACCADDALQTVMTGSAFTKSVSSTFTAGTGNGCLDTGTLAQGWYAVFAIAGADLIQDYLISLSGTSPTMPGGYTYKRRIGWRYINASLEIDPFTQKGDKVWFNAGQSADYTGSPGSYPATLVTVKCPPNTTGIFRVSLVEGGGTNSVLIYVDPTFATSSWHPAVGTSSGWSSSEINVPVDASSQVRISRSGSGTLSSLALVTLGHEDRRGRDS